MSTPPEKSTTDNLLQELLASVATLQKDVNKLKNEGTRVYPQKHLCDGDGNNDLETSGRHGDNVEGNRDSDYEQDPSEDGETQNVTESDGSSFRLSEEGEAFLETTCGSRLEYKSRKAKAGKYGKPDTTWMTCPSLPPVVEVTLPKDAVKEDKIAFRTQEMYMEAMAPLVSCLEQADGEEFTLKEAILMIQSALVLLGDAGRHQSSLRRKELMKHLNPQLQSLMKDSDFKDAQPFLFGEDFVEKAKTKLEAAAALKKTVYPSSSKPKQLGFRPSQTRKNWGHQGGKPLHYGPGKSKKTQGQPSSSKDK